jgi:hypothetical protein
VAFRKGRERSHPENGSARKTEDRIWNDDRGLNKSSSTATQDPHAMTASDARNRLLAILGKNLDRATRERLAAAIERLEAKKEDEAGGGERS